MQVGEFLNQDLPNAANRAQALSMLAVRAQVALGADAVMVAMFDRSAQIWRGYCPGHPVELVHAQISHFVSTTFLDEVRQTNAPLFRSLQLGRMDKSKSWPILGVRFAIGAPLRDLTAPSAPQSFAGVLYLDRRGDHGAFSALEEGKVSELALAASLALAYVDQHLGIATSFGQMDAAKNVRVRDVLNATQGNINQAFKRLSLEFHSRDKLKHFIQNTGLSAHVARARSSYTIEGIKTLILDTQDLRKVGNALGNRRFSTINRFLRHQNPSTSLRALVEKLGLSWESVHGKAFQDLDPKSASVDRL